MSHKLNLGMYSFRIKISHQSDTEVMTIGEFLENAYSGEEQPFVCFADDFLNHLRSLYKTKDRDLGGILLDSKLDAANRKLDIFIDGGITGIKQSLISSTEERQEITPDDTVGLRFFIRFWMEQSNSGYIFIQSYSVLSIRKLIQEILYKTLKDRGFSIVQKHIQKTTTRKRMKEFLEDSVPIAITLINKTSDFDPTRTKTSSARLELRGNLPSITDMTKDGIQQYARCRHGIILEEQNIYRYKVTYRTQDERGDMEERTIPLETDLGDIKLIPNIVVPQECIDKDNYPIFEEMQIFCDNEIKQILREIKED